MSLLLIYYILIYNIELCLNTFKLINYCYFILKGLKKSRIRYYKNMEMQNDTQKDVIDVCEPMKKKMGRPRIHPIKPPREKKYSLYLEDPKAYFREYYHVHTKKVLLCPICGEEFACQTSYNRHARCNKNCIILRLQRQVIKNADMPPL